MNSHQETPDGQQKCQKQIPEEQVQGGEVEAEIEADFQVEGEVEHGQQCNEQWNMDQQVYAEPYYEQQYIYEQPPEMQARSSSQTKTNQQVQINELSKRIYKQAKEINEKTLLGFNWALQLYCYAQFNVEKCYELVWGNSGKLSECIGFITNQQGKGLQEKQQQNSIGLCSICCQPNLLCSNICKHQFCQQCWTFHILHQYHFHPLIPFPLCAQTSCKTRISFSLIDLLSKENPNLHKQHMQSLCRSYATYSRDVKMCKGRKGFNCNRCFYIDKMLAVIECEKCGNLVCPRCGQRFHGPSDCKLAEKWNKQVDTTAGLLEYFEYQSCPKCKNAVERIAGCNEMDCRCKCKFCYLCGQQWSLRHSNNEYCPNIVQISKKYKFRRLLKRKNLIKFDFKIEQKKQSLGTLQIMYQKIDNLRNMIPQITTIFLSHYKFLMSDLRPIQELCNYCKKVICLVWGETMSQYYVMNQRSGFFCNGITKELREVYRFLLDFVLRNYFCVTVGVQERYQNGRKVNEKEVQEIKGLSVVFYDQYLSRLKEVEKTKHLITNLVKQEFDIEFVQLC